MLAKVLFKKNKPYVKKDGTASMAREIHFVREDQTTQDGAEGHEVDKVFPKIDIGHVKVGEVYDFIFDMRSGYNGAYAVLVGIKEPS